jgi:hypothetical protein
MTCLQEWLWRNLKSAGQHLPSDRYLNKHLAEHRSRHQPKHRPHISQSFCQSLSQNFCQIIGHQICQKICSRADQGRSRAKHLPNGRCAAGVYSHESLFWTVVIAKWLIDSPSDSPLITKLPECKTSQGIANPVLSSIIGECQHK